MLYLDSGPLSWVALQNPKECDCDRKLLCWDLWRPVPVVPLFLSLSPFSSAAACSDGQIRSVISHF